MAEQERHNEEMRKLSAELERRRIAGELSKAEDTAWLEALYGGEITPVAEPR